MSEIARRLRGNGTVQGRGHLSLDRKKAREKMRLFRLPDPHLYVVQFVRAASALGAARIDFELGVGNMRCAFAKPLPVARFDDFWAIAFEDRRTSEDAAMHHLALGIGSAQALHPAEIRVRSGRRTIVFTEDGEEVLETPDDGATTIVVKEKFRFGHVFDFFTEHAEKQALQAFCSWSMMHVVVDGTDLQIRRGTYRTTTRCTTDEVFVSLHDPPRSSVFRFLRDDVLVRTHEAAAFFLPAEGVLNSRILQTDLSGLELAPSETLDLLLYDRLYGAYHASLLRWLQDHPHQTDHVALGSDLFAHMRRLAKMRIAPSPQTQYLVSWWLEQREFHPATQCERAQISVADATLDGVIAYATTRRPRVALDDRPMVIFAPSSKLQRVLGKLAAAGHPIVDVTARLEDAEQAVRNREIWEEQPPMVEPVWPVQRRVRRDETRGWLYVPITPDGHIDESEVGLTVHIDGKLVRRTPIALPLGIVIDGPLTPNDAFSDVQRDEHFLELIALLVSQMRPLLVALSRYASEASTKTRTTALHELLSLAMSGELISPVVSAFELPTSLAKKLALDRDPSALEPREKVLRWIGALADEPIFQLVYGGRLTPRELFEQPERPIFLRKPQLPPVNDEHAREVLGRAVRVDRFEEITLRRLRPDAVDGGDLVQRVAARATFMAQPLYEPEPQPILHTARSSVVATDESLLLEVQLLGDGSSCDTYLLLHGRLLAMRRWSSPGGRFRAILRSDHFKPHPQYVDVEENALYFMAEQWTQSLMASALEDWGRAAREHPLHGTDAFRLLWRTSAAQAVREPGEACLPVLRWAGTIWRPELVTLDELRAQVDRDGGVVRVVRPGERLPPPPPDVTLAVRMPSSTAELRKVLPGTRVISATAGSPRREAMERFLERPPADPHVSGAVLTTRGVCDDIHFEVGIFADHSGGTASPSNRIDVLYEGRHLERFVESVPAGYFRTIVTGRAISPDPDFEFVAEPRGDVRRAALVGAAQLLRTVCQHFANRRDGPLGALEGLRHDLMRFLALCHAAEPPPPFDVAGALQSTPLFESTSGTRVSFADLADLAVDGAVPYTHSRSDAAALIIARSELRLVDLAFGPHYRLRPAEQMDLPAIDTGVTVPTRARFHSDAILDAVAALLVDARGDRRDLFDDRLAHSLQWASVDGLCAVGADGIRIDPHHPIVAHCVARRDDPTPRRFLAAILYSHVNRKDSSVADRDELEVLARLLGA